jgi:hypothetical protein
LREGFAETVFLSRINQEYIYFLIKGVGIAEDWNHYRRSWKWSGFERCAARNRYKERIYCLGDMIGIGPDTNEVLGLLFSRMDSSMITGNHDEAILALLKREEYPLSHYAHQSTSLMDRR